MNRTRFGGFFGRGIVQPSVKGKFLPDHIHRKFEAYLKCGRLEHGFLRVRCDKCHFARLVAFSCKKRGFCPSCGARRMAETAHPGRLLDGAVTEPE